MPTRSLGGTNTATTTTTASTSVFPLVTDDQCPGAVIKLDELFFTWLTQRDTLGLVDHCISSVRRGQPWPTDACPEVGGCLPFMMIFLPLALKLRWFSVSKGWLTLPALFMTNILMSIIRLPFEAFPVHLISITRNPHVHLHPPLPIRHYPFSNVASRTSIGHPARTAVAVAVTVVIIVFTVMAPGVWK